MPSNKESLKKIYLSAGKDEIFIIYYPLKRRGGGRTKTDY